MNGNINKRLLREIRNLIVQQNQRELLDNDYLIYFDDNNINIIHAIIKAPFDSIYKHKFVRLDFKIPDNYPYSPPEVWFINHDEVRIHPNMYTDGKCCATILNTWGDDPLEKWTSSMGIETILLTFHSFLDNNPYIYEPGGRDNESYTTYVQFQTWYSCLIRYLQREKIPLFREFIDKYLINNMGNIFDVLYNLNDRYKPGEYFSNCFEIDYYFIDYLKIAQILEALVDNSIDSLENSYNTNTYDEQITNDNYHIGEYKCNICFDTERTIKMETENNKKNKKFNNKIILECNHGFHTNCLRNHMITNGNICPMCRKELHWIFNPLTKRRVKIGSRTWQYLKENNFI